MSTKYSFLKNVIVYPSYRLCFTYFIGIKDKARRERLSSLKKREAFKTILWKSELVLWCTWVTITFKTQQRLRYHVGLWKCIRIVKPIAERNTSIRNAALVVEISLLGRGDIAGSCRYRCGVVWPQDNSHLVHRDHTDVCRVFNDNLNSDEFSGLRLCSNSLFFC